MGFNVDDIKQRNPLRQYVETMLGKPKMKGNKYDMYKCPFHNETKGASLAVYDESWTCFGSCDCSGDVIDFAMRYHNCTNKKEAMILLGGDNTPRRHYPMPPPPPPVKIDTDEPPNEEWQFYAHKVVEMAKAKLWSSKYPKGLDYLRYYRWLNDDVIRDHDLGYIPGNHDQWVQPFPDWKLDGKTVSVPCGIVIPHYADGHLWQVRVRRSGGDVKYQGIRGGKRVLYGADGITMGRPLIITEGEFDAMVIRNLWRYELVSAVALAGASNHRLHHWLPKLVTVPRIFARMDADGAGAKALAGLTGISESVIPVQVPDGKDITDYVDAHGLYMLLQWIKCVLSSEVNHAR
jgi:DNA primase